MIVSGIAYPALLLELGLSSGSNLKTHPAPPIWPRVSVSERFIGYFLIFLKAHIRKQLNTTIIIIIECYHSFIKSVRLGTSTKMYVDL